eukprot:3498413-Pleurochrysis_carterae.AAC.1
MNGRRLQPHTLASRLMLRPSMPESPSSRSLASSLASRRNVWSCSTHSVGLGAEEASLSQERMLLDMVAEVLDTHQLESGVVLGEWQCVDAGALGEWQRVDAGVRRPCTRALRASR